MPTTACTEIDIADIIRREQVVTYQQPIVSVTRQAIIGMETLSRGIDAGGDMISPLRLFQRATREGMIIPLDRLCRRRALESFAPVQQQCLDKFISINLDSSIIDQGIVGSGHVRDLVRTLCIDPHRVVIEIIESRVNDLNALASFVAIHKAYGFMIALDDFGSGHSNMERIPIIKPDILKLDRMIISGIDREYYKQEVVKSLVRLAKKIGALVIAEGVEREEEVLACLEFGVDMFQGFYFARPQPFDHPLPVTAHTRLHAIAERFKTTVVERIRERKTRHQQYEAILQRLLKDLVKMSLADADARLAEMIQCNTAIECLYVLDENGVQLTETVCDCAKMPVTKRLIFSPAPKGADHSLKDYFLFLNAGLLKYTSDLYISSASGNPCFTISAMATMHGVKRCILCVDFNPDYLAK